MRESATIVLAVAHVSRLSAVLLRTLHQATCLVQYSELRGTSLVSHSASATSPRKAKVGIVMCLHVLFSRISFCPGITKVVPHLCLFSPSHLSLDLLCGAAGVLYRGQSEAGTAGQHVWRQAAAAVATHLLHPGGHRVWHGVHARKTHLPR